MLKDLFATWICVFQYQGIILIVNNYNSFCGVKMLAAKCYQSFLIQYCEKVMQTIIDEYREYRRYLTRFYLERYIKRYLVRAIVSFLGEISLSLCEISFPVSDILFSLCNISFPLRDKSFPLSEISFPLSEISFRFNITSFPPNKLSSRHCEIHVHFSKDHLR